MDCIQLCETSDLEGSSPLRNVDLMLPALSKDLKQYIFHKNTFLQLLAKHRSKTPSMDSDLNETELFEWVCMHLKQVEPFEDESDESTAEMLFQYQSQQQMTSASASPHKSLSALLAFLGWTLSDVNPFHGNYKHKIEFDSAKLKRKLAWSNQRLSMLLHTLLRLADDATQPTSSRVKALALLGSIGSGVDYCKVVHGRSDVVLNNENVTGHYQSNYLQGVTKTLEDIPKQLFFLFVLHKDPHVAFTAACTLQLLLYKTYDGCKIVSDSGCKDYIPSLVNARKHEALLDRNSKCDGKKVPMPPPPRVHGSDKTERSLQARMVMLNPHRIQHSSDLHSSCLCQRQIVPAKYDFMAFSAYTHQDPFQSLMEFADSDVWVLSDPIHYTVWICRLTASLAALSRSKTIQLLSDMCALPQSEELSEFLFPHIVHNLLSNTKEKEGSSRVHTEELSTCLSCAFNRLINCGVCDVIVLVVNTLLFLFNRSKQEFLALTERQCAERRGLPFTGGEDSYNSIGLDVNLLQISAAALRIGKPLVALQLLEVWCELPSQRLRCHPSCNGRLSFPDVDSDVAEVEISGYTGARQLLQAIFRAIGEDDANDSAAATSLQGGVELKDLINRYENNGRWLQLLEASDVMLSGASSAHRNQNPTNTGSQHHLSSDASKDWDSSQNFGIFASESSPSSTCFNSSLQLGICKSLNQLGLQHVLKPYLATIRFEAVPVGGGSSGGDTRAKSLQNAVQKEFTFELAWKCCQWTIDNGGSLPRMSYGGLQEQDMNSTVMISNQVGFHESMHRCLKSFSQADGIGFRTEIYSCRKRLLVQLRENEDIWNGYRSMAGSRFSTNRFKFFLMQLQCLLEMEEMWDVVQLLEQDHGYLTRENSFGVQETEVALLVRKWDTRSMHKMLFDRPSQDVLHLRVVLLKLCNLKTEMAHALLQLSSAARKAKDFSVSRRCIHELTSLRLNQKDSTVVADVQLLYLNIQIERSKVFWKSLETKAAIQVGRHVCLQLGKQMAIMVEFKSQTKLQDKSSESTTAHHQNLVAIAEKTVVVASALRRTGKWMGENKLDTSQVILDEYLRRAEHTVKEGLSFYITHVKNAPDSAIPGNDTRATYELLKSSRAKANLELAEFTSALYDKVHDRIRSEEWKHAVKAGEMRKRELQKCQDILQGKGADAMSQKYDAQDIQKIKAYEKELRMDIDIESKTTSHVEKSESKFLIEAIRHFGKAMSYSRKPDLKAVFRTVSLWLRNANDLDVNGAMSSAVIKVVSTHKFVPLSYQICGRLTSDNTPFQVQVEELISKMAAQHPHHLLPQLIALKNGQRVEGTKAADYSVIASSKVCGVHLIAMFHMTCSSCLHLLHTPSSH
jgi:hypothetical protein